MAEETEAKTVAEAPPLAAGQIEVWKKIVDVQQHFNDLELRIRNFAMIVTGAFLGLGGYAIKDGGAIGVLGAHLSVAGLVVLSAVLPLAAFYFMDRFWYHRLLDGAVEAGVEAEQELKALGYKVDLGTKISARSPFQLFGRTKKFWLFGSRDPKIRSGRKMDIFYAILLLSLLIVASFLIFGYRPQPTSTTQAALTNCAASASSLAATSASLNAQAAASAARAAQSAPAAALSASAQSSQSTGSGSGKRSSKASVRHAPKAPIARSSAASAAEAASAASQGASAPITCR
jgi:pyruvate/2-oxoglutarate dehydrogenase complex dihydrolipoamide acyltransferase (E2) component